MSPQESLAAWREQVGLSFARAGEKLGVSGPTLHDWVHGKKRPSDEHRQALEIIAGIPRDSWRTPEEHAVVVRAQLEAGTGRKPRARKPSATHAKAPGTARARGAPGRAKAAGEG